MTKMVGALADKALSTLLPSTTAKAFTYNNDCWNYCGTDHNCRWCCLEPNGHLECGVHHSGCGAPYC